MKQKIGIALLSASVFLVHSAAHEETHDEGARAVESAQILIKHGALSNEHDFKAEDYRINPRFHFKDNLSIDPAPCNPIPFPARFRQPEELHDLNRELLHQTMKHDYEPALIELEPRYRSWNDESTAPLNPVPYTAGGLRSQGADTRRTMVDFEIPTLTHHSSKPSIRDLPAYAAYLKTRDPFELDAQTDADIQEQINQFAREEVSKNEQAKATLEKILSTRIPATLPHPHGIITNNASEFVPAPINFDVVVDDVDIHCTQIPFRYHDPAPAHRSLLLPEEQQYAMSRGLLYDAAMASLDDQLDLDTEIKMADLLSDELFFLREHCPALMEDKDALWNTILVRIENQKENASPKKLVELNTFHQFVLQRQSHEQASSAHPLLGTSFEEVD